MKENNRKCQPKYSGHSNGLGCALMNFLCPLRVRRNLLKIEAFPLLRLVFSAWLRAVKHAANVQPSSHKSTSHK